MQIIPLGDDMVKLISTITNILWTHVVSRFQNPAGTLRIGAYTYGSPKTLAFRNDDVVIIGKFCSIADDVIIVSGGEHRYDRVSTYPLKSRFLDKREVDSYNKGPVVIGNDVWIGTRAIILSGIKIGSGAVIAASAVVTQKVPPYAIVAGVPARVVGYRFSQDQIEKLLHIAWWNWNIEKIVDSMDFFYGNVDDFIAEFSEKQKVSNE